MLTASSSSTYSPMAKLPSKPAMVNTSAASPIATMLSIISTTSNQPRILPTISVNSISNMQQRKDPLKTSVPSYSRLTMVAMWPPLAAQPSNPWLTTHTSFFLCLPGLQLKSRLCLNTTEVGKSRKLDLEQNC